MPREVWYHGGPRGLQRILPPAATHVPGTAAYGSRLARRDRVYLVNSYAGALLYACVWPDGVIY